jgi:polysaccharide export outer membrane protein
VSQSPPRVPEPPPSTRSVTEINEKLVSLGDPGRGSWGDYKIGPEDLLTLTIYNISEKDAVFTPRVITARVSQDGKITLPMIGEVAVEGSTLKQVERLVRQRYDKYIREPEIGVVVTEYRQRVSVIGAVQKSGLYELTGPKTVIDILAMAGGVTEKAGSQVHIYRRDARNGRESHILDLEALVNNAELITAANVPHINLLVEPGDVINVPQAGMFFVDGAVRKPGSYPLGRRYTLSQALATAGGVDPELNSSDITVFRRRGAGDTETIGLNLNDVLAGTTADPYVKADDVIVVPVSTGKYIVKRFIGTLVGGMSLGSFIRPY